MNELLEALPPGALVLDLGCAGGSFRVDSGAVTVVRVDLEPARNPEPNFAQADAARLPFRDRCFDLIVSNHSLEHFEDLEAALREIGRISKPGAALYVSVPDASTFTDRLYRWLARGGGHVNAFSSSAELASKIQAVTGLKHIATRTLCSSLSFLNRRNAPKPRPKRLLLLGDGTEASLHLISYFSRLSDRLLGTRLSVYGWALYFGNITAPIDLRPWGNVCVRCGSGHPPERLRDRHWLVPVYSCPDCGARNYFAPGNPHLK